MLRVILLFVCISIYAQKPYELVFNDIGVQSTPKSSKVKMRLVHRFQGKKARATDHPKDIYDGKIYSPKSVNYLKNTHSFYVHNLEGLNTMVYDLSSMELKKTIWHRFREKHSNLFKNGEHTLFDYTYRKRKTEHNIFDGKPVESCFSHSGRYLWVTYYRRSYDPKAESPSAVAIIDTEINTIVRVMPTGALPKMIAASPDNTYLAITHWGDNTIGIVDISSDNPQDFAYIKLFAVGKRLKLNFDDGVDRDSNCGYCLRGTSFTPDSKYLFVGRMSGGGIAIFDMEKQTYLGTSFGSKANIRHIIVQGDDIVISTNATGFVQRTKWRDMLSVHRTAYIKTGKKRSDYIHWESVYLGYGVRTVTVTQDGKYAFACVNSLSKVMVVDLNTMKKVAEIPSDSYPVGMDLMGDDKYLAVTSQGRAKQGGGHSVMIYEINISE